MTDADRLLEVLADGKPHNHLSLYDLRMIVHSRVADLRKRGHVINCWSDNHPNGRRYWYQLVASPPLTDGGGATGASSLSSRTVSADASPSSVSGDARSFTTRGGASSPAEESTDSCLPIQEGPGRAPATGRDQLSLLEATT